MTTSKPEYRELKDIYNSSRDLFGGLLKVRFDHVVASEHLRRAQKLTADTAEKVGEVVMLSMGPYECSYNPMNQEWSAVLDHTDARLTGTGKVKADLKVVTAQSQSDWEDPRFIVDVNPGQRVSPDRLKKLRDKGVRTVQPGTPKIEETHPQLGYVPSH